MHGETLKYIVTSFAVLWQHVFQFVACVLSALHRAALSTHATT